MKYTLLFMAVFFLNSSHAMDELNQKVKELSESGFPIINYNSLHCRNKNNDVTQLWHQLGKYPLCVKHEKLPSSVLHEVYNMEKNELENESDYDSRITKLYRFNHDYFDTKEIKIKDVRRLIKSFNIPQSHTSSGIKIEEKIFQVSDLDRFTGLYINGDYFEKSETLEYLRLILQGKNGVQVHFGDGVELYPGGGFSVDHYFFITNTTLIYVKHSWWDA